MRKGNMVIKSIVRATCACITVFACNANAIIVDGKDWLQVTATTGITSAQLDSIFDTTTGTCDVAVCTIAGTALDLTDYTWANTADLNSLFDHYAPGIEPLIPYQDGLSMMPDGVDIAVAFADFDPTLTQIDRQDVFGWTRDIISPTSASFMSISDAYANDPDFVDLHVNLSSSSSYTYIGAWLYRDPVSAPEPSIALLMASGLTAFGVTRRKSRV